MPIGFAVVAAAISVPFAWMGRTPITQDCDILAPTGEELGDYEDRTSFWPPGFRCTYIAPDGAPLGEVTYVTWYEVTLAGLFVAAVFLSTALALGVIPVRRFALAATTAAVMFVAASAAFFA